MLIDLIILLVILTFAIVGKREQAVESDMKLAPWVLGFLLLWMFEPSCVAILNDNIEGITPFAAFGISVILALFAVIILFNLTPVIANPIIIKMKKFEQLNFSEYMFKYRDLASRILSYCIGVLKGLIVSTFVLCFLHFVPAKGSLKKNYGSLYNILHLQNYPASRSIRSSKSRELACHTPPMPLPARVGAFLMS
jgi:uncharacterized membrane protein required for colicin V production